MAEEYYKPCKELDICNELMEKYWDKKEYKKCFEGHLVLAEQGYPLAECQVGFFYLEGIGVEKDFEKALFWTERAAVHGDRDGQCNLAWIYEEGFGVEKNIEKVKYWYKQAALQGHDLAIEKCEELNIEITRHNSISLHRAGTEHANQIWKMQVEAFSKLYEKYQDTETSPATEPIEKVIMRLQQPFTYYYFIECNGEVVGAIRVVDKKEIGKAKRISPIFIMEQYRNRGLAQLAMEEAERLHGSDNWELDTILEEEGNCYLYEKMGYSKTGKIEKINEKMTIVFYKKE